MDLKTEQYIRDLDAFQQMLNNVEDEEIKSFLVKLFCIRTAGLVEVFLKTRISSYSTGKVSKEISRFLTTKFKEITNLKSSRIEEVLVSFSMDWSNKFRAYISEHDKQRTSLDSVIAHRHSIAHGHPSTISSALMAQYYDDVKKIVCFLDNLIR